MPLPPLISDNQNFRPCSSFHLKTRHVFQDEAAEMMKDHPIEELA